MDLILTSQEPEPEQTGFIYPKSLADKYQPPTIEEFVGHEKIRKIMLKFVAEPYTSNWLFKGSPGIGKSTMALALAKQIPADLHHIASRACNLETVEAVAKDCHYFPWHNNKMHLVLVDEADEMTEAAQLAFLSKMDGTNPLPNTVIVFTANSTEGLQKKFLSRCRVLDFSTYGMAAATVDLLAKVWKLEAGDAPMPNLARIVKDSCNDIREAYMKLEVALLEI